MTEINSTTTNEQQINDAANILYLCTVALRLVKAANLNDTNQAIEKQAQGYKATLQDDLVNKVTQAAQTDINKIIENNKNFWSNNKDNLPESDQMIAAEMAGCREQIGDKITDAHQRLELCDTLQHVLSRAMWYMDKFNDKPFAHTSAYPDEIGFVSILTSIKEQHKTIEVPEKKQTFAEYTQGVAYQRAWKNSDAIINNMKKHCNADE